MKALKPAVADPITADGADLAPLWLVRHARVLIDPGVCYGALDVPACPQATREAAEVLAQHLPSQAMLLTSPLQRCELLTLAVRALRPDLTHKTDARLAEMNFGCWEGQRWDSIPKTAYETWTADFWEHRFGGAESVADFMARVAQAWAPAQAASMAGVPQVWFTHAGVIRAVNLLSQGVHEVRDAAKWPADAPAFGQWCCVGSPCALGTPHQA